MMMQVIVRSANIIRQSRWFALAFHAIAAFLILALVQAVGASLAAAASLSTPGVVNRATSIVRVQTQCDTRGCFTYGPRQSYHRPDYRPLGQTGSRYYSPRAAGPPHFVYQPRLPKPQVQVRPPIADLNLHQQNCMSRYRSYDPLTDRYVGSGGKSIRCVLPAR